MGNEFNIEGFSFESKDDYEMAKREQEVIAYMRTKIDYHNTKNVSNVYYKLIEKQSFQTIIGYSFLHELQKYIIASGQSEEKDLVCIPVHRIKKNKDSFETREQKIGQNGKNLSLSKELKQKKIYLRNAGIIIAALCIMIISIVVITLYSGKNPLIDAEEKIQNKYAAWEEELKAREAEVREKEKELGISNP